MNPSIGRVCGYGRAVPRALFAFVVAISLATGAQAQNARPAADREPAPSTAPAGLPRSRTPAEVRTVDLRAARYSDRAGGASSIDLVRRALDANRDLAAGRLDIDRARARLRQAGLRPNPTIDVEYRTGRPTGSPGERETSVGVALPLEVGGQRGRRIDLAEAELRAAEAEVADRARRLRAEVLTAYIEALSALRELESIERLNLIDIETSDIVAARVVEGESAPLELNLLRVEVARLKSRVALVEGRLQASLLRLKSLAGIPVTQPLLLREDLTQPPQIATPGTRQEALDVALRSRPDLMLARLNEAVARAGLALRQAEARPDVTLFSRFSAERSLSDLPAPLVPVPDRDRTLAFGVSIGLPVFNRNQGALEESEAAIAQAERRREYVEELVRAEVESAFARYEAAQTSLGYFDEVMTRSSQNIANIRVAYQLGVYRVTDLLAEQRRFVEAQREHTEALAGRYTALADLEAAIGASLVPNEAPSKEKN